MKAAFGSMQVAFALRRQVMCGGRDWQALYRGAIAPQPPAPAAAAAAAVEARFVPSEPPLAPGIDPLLLQELRLRLLAVAGAVSDAKFASALLVMCVDSLQQATPQSADKARVAACLQLMWLRIGRELLQAAGEADPELDADAEAAAPEDTADDGRGQLMTCRDASTVAVPTASEFFPDYAARLMLTFWWHSCKYCTHAAVRSCHC